MSFDKLKIENKLSGLVGYRQPADPDFFTLDATNLASSSGYYVNDNPFAKLELLLATQDYAGMTEDKFNSKLTQVTNNAINYVCNSVFSDVGSQDYLDRSLLYNYPMNRVNLTSIPDGFVFEKIQVRKKENTAIEITRVLLDFDGTGDIELKLYSSSSITPLQTQIVSITGPHQEVELNWVLDNTDGVTGGEYYLGYDNTGLSVTPYKRDFERSNIRSQYSCLTLSQRTVKGYTGTDLWDLTKEEAISEYTGLNLDITVYNDYTDLITQNKSLFSIAIFLEAQIQFLNEYSASIRSNKDQRMAQQITTAIQETAITDTGKVVTTGLRPSLIAQVANIRKQIEKLQRGYFTGMLTVETLS